jgi:DNA-binding NarL/FixJ family response regulator
VGRRRRPARPGREPFTPREGAVAAGLLRGETRRAIARGLAVSDETVKTHLGRIYRKLGVTDRRAAVRVLAPSRAVPPGR